MQYRHKLGIFVGIVASFTLFLAYITGPKSLAGPKLRVLHISYSNHAAVKRNLQTSNKIVTDEIVEEIKIAVDGSVTIDREEWDLKSATADFYKSNLVLECSASFPVSWKYSGFGEPSISEENVRIHADFNDSSTFTYLSLLNLMPIDEKSTGNYTCFGVENQTEHPSSSVHLFVPGSNIFLIDYDTTIEAPGENNIFVPCPVSNISANVSLYFKGQPVTSENIENLLSYDPRAGFYLKPRFVEEQAEPWGQFYCKVEETREKSGTITLQPMKGLIVNAIPDSNVVIISKPVSATVSKIKGNEALEEEKVKFICQAKEEISLKFLRVVVFPSVNYEYNASATFPYSASVEVIPKQVRNSSRIYCRTTRNNEDLHSWRVIFSSEAMRSELMEFDYDESREEFACCSPSNKRAKLTLLPCSSISECRIKGNCLLPGRKCNSDDITTLPQRSGCARHKIMKGNEKNSISSRSYNKVEETNEDEDGINVDSGLLQCVLEGKSIERVYFTSRYESDNGTVSNTISGMFNGVGFDSMMALDIELPNRSNFLMEIHESSTSNPSKRRFQCRGAKFFLAVGFLWQVVYVNKEMKVYYGKDSIKGPWIQSQLHLPIKRIGLKRVYCIAPLWESSKDSDWINVSLELA